ncbi:MAG: RsmF rRNA methyltransferase first C-terminal domain-containing protein [Lachnospiraceae bacterium]|nr:RsmF rRNA methyltransferase first C-terminal domain-containing protein [Lachnospiraceae bacterium]
MDNYIVKNTDNTEKVGNDYRVILPHDFTDRMRKLLQDEYQDFLASYEKERLYGLRYNPLKAANKSKDLFLSQMPFKLEPVPWTDEGFYYKQSAQPGKHAFHEAGAYYIQEPSAMAVVEVLAPKPGERILDLCAAPGGKSTHIAGKMMGEGLLISNEIIPGRAKILSQNIERMGISNAVVCNETPERLSEFFPSYFDRILVDAPCSGEGMFRKDETAINEWSPENVKMCADRQKMILENAAFMLKPGGVLVYSTCTFSVEENEGMINGFLKEHEEFAIEKTQLEDFFGHRERIHIEAWIENSVPDIEHTIRLWPHKIDGEGHFIARLKKAGERYENTVPIKPAETNPKNETRKKKENKNEKADMDDIRLCKSFLKEELGLFMTVEEKLMKRGVFISFGEQIYLMPEQIISVKGLKVVRPGLHLGTIKKSRFEPSHALALYLSKDDVAQYYEMNENETESYLHGDVFPCDLELKGWVLLITSGYSVGFGKAGNGQMKNHYPKGLRK